MINPLVAFGIGYLLGMKRSKPHPGTPVAMSKKRYPPMKRPGIYSKPRR